jgi:hypothetical protein
MEAGLTKIWNKNEKSRPGSPGTAYWHLTSPADRGNKVDYNFTTFRISDPFGV